MQRSQRSDEMMQRVAEMMTCDDDISHTCDDDDDDDDDDDYDYDSSVDQQPVAGVRIITAADCW